MAVSNQDVPNLTGSYSNIIQAQNNRANLELQRPQLTDVATAGVKAVDKTLTDQREFEKKMKAEGRVLVTDEGIAEFAKELNLDPSEFSSFKGLYVKPEEAHAFGVQKALQKTFAESDKYTPDQKALLATKEGQTQLAQSEFPEQKSVSHVVVPDKNSATGFRYATIDNNGNIKFTDLEAPKPGKGNGGSDKPQITTLPNGAKAQVFVGDDGKVTLEQLTGPKAPNPSQAGQFSSLRNAVKDINDYEDAIIKKDKNGNDIVNKNLLFKANFPFGGVPFSEGRTINSLIENAVQTKLRIETGAQANESEVKKIAERFRPTVDDKPDTVRNKIARLRTYMQEAVQIADPEQQLTGDISFFRKNYPKILSVKEKKK